MSKASRDDPELAQRARRLTSGRNAPKAGRALGEMGARALPALREALTNENPFVRSGALHGLAAVTPTEPDAVSAITGALATDSDPRVRETACMMLAQLGEAAVASAREALDRAVNDRDERVREAARAALDAAQPSE